MGRPKPHKSLPIPQITEKTLWNYFYRYDKNNSAKSFWKMGCGEDNLFSKRCLPRITFLHPPLLAAVEGFKFQFAFASVGESFFAGECFFLHGDAVSIQKCY